MAYVRWSTVINSGLSIQEEMLLYSEIKDFEKFREKLLEKEGSYLSNWYIYWHATYPESKCREDQCLAVIHNNGKSHILSYDYIKEIYNAKNWSYFGENIDQTELLERCLKEWLDEVEELEVEN
tara:strand:- start:299 stop:670 length:372 start_codon:yes stop_codon:yes gene_type:complete